MRGRPGHGGVRAAVYAVIVVGCAFQRDEGFELDECSASPGPEAIAQAAHSFIQHRTQKAPEGPASIAWLGPKAAARPSTRELGSREARRAATQGDLADDENKVGTKKQRHGSKRVLFSQVVFNILLVVAALVAIFFAARRLLRKDEENREQRSEEKDSEQVAPGAKQEQALPIPTAAGHDRPAEAAIVVDEAKAVAGTRESYRRKKDESGKAKTADQAEELAQPSQKNQGDRPIEPKKREELTQLLQLRIPSPISEPEASSLLADGPSLLADEAPSEASSIEDRIVVDLKPRPDIPASAVDNDNELYETSSIEDRFVVDLAPLPGSPASSADIFHRSGEPERAALMTQSVAQDIAEESIIQAKGSGSHLEADASSTSDESSTVHV